MMLKKFMFVCAALLQISLCKCSPLLERAVNKRTEDVNFENKEITFSRERKDQCECGWCGDTHGTNPAFCCACGCPCGGGCYDDGPQCCQCLSSDSSSTEGGCFPSSVEVYLENEKSVTMSQLQVGDQVQTVSSGGSVMYSEVRAFIKKDNTVTTMFTSIITSWNRTISLTGNHLIYARKSCTDKFNPIYADQVEIGYEVLVHESDELTPSVVINVSNLPMQGTFMPLTMEGTIVVDGVLTSCYASIDHTLGHIAMAPMRWFPKIMGKIFGEDSGFSVYAYIAEDLGKWMLPSDKMNEFRFLT